jgi:hypothetical protein
MSRVDDKKRHDAALPLCERADGGPPAAGEATTLAFA